MEVDFDKGSMTFTREDLLEDLERLQSFYNIFGKEMIIDWLLEKNIHKIEVETLCKTKEN